MTLYIALVTFGFGVLITFLCLMPRLKRTKFIDDKTAESNRELELINQELNTTNLLLKQEKELLQQQNIEATQRINDLHLNISELEKRSTEAGTIFYEQSMELARQKVQEDLKIEQAKYNDAILNYSKEFLQMMSDSAQEFEQETKKQTIQYEELKAQEKQLQSTIKSAIAAAKRAEEIKNKADFYKLQLSDIDIEEIHKLRSIASYLRDQESLNKVIWKMYYEKPTTDLIGRVIGSGVHTGIYKITNLDNQKCYVGQAVNLADRWKQHIKRGVGAEAPTRNKLYPAMLAVGVERFSFEVIEECTRDQLDAREDYWQNYFGAKEFGYSIK